MENNNIDKTFNEASKALEEPATFPGFDKVWNQIEEKLDKKEEKKKKMPSWIPYGIAASLMIGFGTFYFVNKSEIPTENTSYTVAENVTGPKNTHIEKIDSTVKSNIQSQIETPTLPKKQEILAYHQEKSFEKPVIISSNEIENPLGRQLYKEISAPALPKVTDSAKRKNIEEVVVMGLKKDKIASNASTSLVSSSDMVRSKMKLETDTAEALAYSNSQFEIKNELKEPLVLGYNSTYLRNKKKAASNTILAEKVGDQSMANMLQGRVAGLSMSPSGNPGSGKVDVIIRGAASAKENPLYIIDGKPTNLDEFRTLDPNRIVAITVLKDEKATEFFGNKASGGAIVVETKDISRAERKKINEILIKAGVKKK
ncbi:TonB-dependent receptor plug domain-containing protein [Chryseobacterium sp.]|uniref:TonB-dependent receptor plug domain-containing protein n=1 Tax=Chryseobacterium sp. TaxID=1871047 RepID=UPI00289E7844|nr:TonB-dependent receptor plug domain-containing protein [Chryseobacterium sp.]